VLKWTYPVRYYGEIAWKAHETELFKFQQQALETACEKTHGALEEDLTPYLDPSETDRTPFAKYRGRVTNLTTVLKNQYEQFIEAVLHREF
tara:strand:- start:140 stop:412 length:273 start_codon:yes stop_codon:yes gene_type:complete